MEKFSKIDKIVTQKKRGTSLTLLISLSTILLANESVCYRDNILNKFPDWLAPQTPAANILILFMLEIEFPQLNKTLTLFTLHWWVKSDTKILLLLFFLELMFSQLSHIVSRSCSLVKIMRRNESLKTKKYSKYNLTEK